MTRAEYGRTLRYMEHIRMASYEAESATHKTRLIMEYRSLEAAIAPYAFGEKPFSDESQESQDLIAKMGQ